MSFMRNSLGALAALALGCAIVAAQDAKSAATLEWSLAGDVMYLYKADLRVVAQDTAEIGKKDPDWKNASEFSTTFAVSSVERDARGIHRKAVPAQFSTVELKSVSHGAYLHVLQLATALPPADAEPGKACPIDSPSSQMLFKLKHHVTLVETKPNAAGIAETTVQGSVTATQKQMGPGNKAPVDATVALDYQAVFAEGRMQIVTIADLRVPSLTMAGQTLRFEGVIRLASASRPTDSAFAKRVDDAIAKGVEYLKKTPGGDDASFIAFSTGEQALALLALVKSDVAPDDKVLLDGLAALCKADLAATSESYTPALCCLVVEAYMEKYAARSALPKEHANYLPPMKPAAKKQLDTLLETAAARLLWIFEQTGGKGWTYVHDNKVTALGGSVDYSNTQYGMLGLLAAAKYGVKIKPEIWAKILTEHVEAQTAEGAEVETSYTFKGGVLRRQDDKDAPTVVQEKTKLRGWGYYAATGASKDFATPTKSMTWGGLGTLAGARARLLEARKLGDKLDAASQRAMQQALAWLQHNGLLVDASDQAGYALYSMEKAASLASLETLGGHDWYFINAVPLLERQLGNGGWSAYGGKTASRVETAFALLFLTRGTRSLAVVTTGGK